MAIDILEGGKWLMIDGAIDGRPVAGCVLKMRLTRLGLASKGSGSEHSE